MRAANEKERRENEAIAAVRQIKTTCDDFMTKVELTHAETIQALSEQNLKNEKLLLD